MGRTSRFNFPVPGRKAKQTPPPSIPAGPTSKAHKILGTADINTGGGRPKKAWDAASASGISVTVSESTYSQSDAAFGISEKSVVEHASVNGDAGWHQTLAERGPGEQEVESGIIPTLLQPVDEISNKRRNRLSTSTISSFYDKAKVPLSISQQTSSSAIARGPPILRAQSLVDSEDQETQRKKKPTRLDFSSLLTRHRSTKSFVLGPDMMTRSPSVLSVATEATVPAPHTSAERRLSRMATSESLQNEHLEESQSQPKGTTDTKRLRNLYDHYEQMTFRNIIGEDIEEVESPVVPQHPDIAEDSDEDNQKSSRETVPVILKDESQSISWMNSQPENIPQSIQDSRSTLVIPNSSGIKAADCSASISSKHTRTSKTSRRTNQSLLESDLHEKSILSLSDDSDDDFASENASLSVALSVPPERANTIASQPAIPHPRKAQTSSVMGINPRRSSLNKIKRTPRVSNRQYLSPPPTTPPTASLPELPKATTRPASAMPAATIWMGLSESRYSTKGISSEYSSRGHETKPNYKLTTSAGNSETSKQNNTSLTEHSPSSARSRPFERSTVRSLASVSPASQRGRTRTANCTSSILPHQLPQYTSLSPSRISDIRKSSEYSVRPFSSEDSNVKQQPGSHESLGNSRFIAVTKQEEMLLSALRNKRKLMRDTLIAELRERDKTTASLVSHRRVSSLASSVDSVDVGNTRSERRRLSISGFSSGSSMTMDVPTEPSHKRRRSSLAGPPSHLTFATSAMSDQASMNGPQTPGPGLNPTYKQEYCVNTLAPSAKHSSPESPSLYTRLGDSPLPSPQHLSFISPGNTSTNDLDAERHERVLLFLDSPNQEKQESTIYDAEPCLDLSDFEDFDYLSQNPLTPAATGQKYNSSHGDHSPGADSFGCSAPLQSGQDKDLDPMPRELPGDNQDDETGTPRPDSPISPTTGFFPDSPHQEHQRVRISAVGPPGGAPPAWLVDEDPIQAY